jgi:hypothetical protein
VTQQIPPTLHEAVALTTAYLPPVQYFTKLLSYGTVWLEQYDNYIKQTYRNRCIIAAPDGPLTLTVPVEKPDTVKCPMKDIRISDHGRWRHLHWNALVSAYENSPFFEYYADDFLPFYERRWTYLVDFNEELTAMLCRLIDLQPNIHRTREYLRPADNLSDMRDAIHPKHGWATDTAFTPHPYYQVFADKNGFLPNLSIVDLLFNMGPESLIVLHDSVPSTAVSQATSSESSSPLRR